MSNIPSDLKYSKSHEWVRIDDNGDAVVGITDHAQSLLGELVFVESPEVGQTVSVGDEAGVVESVKAASDVYSPVSGEVVEINEALADTPGLVNESPYDGGWLFKVSLSDEQDLLDLMEPDVYAENIESDE